MDESAAKALSTGLKLSFSGNSIQDTAERGGVTFQTRDVAREGFTYHDEYTGLKSTAGQEIVRIGDIIYARSYQGRAIDVKELAKLGLDEMRVIEHLIHVIVTHSAPTRLDTDYHLKEDGSPWEYIYVVTDRDEKFGLIRSTEIIKYNDQEVFRHDFIISPIEG